MTRSRKHKIAQLFYQRLYGPVLWRSSEEQAWLNAPAVGREFGSPDYHRYEQMDGHAFDTFGDMVVAHQWMSQPHPDLGGLAPNDCASSDAQLHKVLDLLTKLKSQGQPETGGQTVPTVPTDEG